MKKYIIILLLSAFDLKAQPTAADDTIFTNMDFFISVDNKPFVPDTIKFNLLSNDHGTNIKVIEYSVNCVRYPPGTTQRSIANFGKIKIAANGTGTFITTKPGTLPKITSFVYTINDGRCGTSQAKVFVLDSEYYYLRDTTKVWIWMGNQRCYYHTENGEYYIVFPDKSKLLIKEEEYFKAVTK